MEIPANYSLVYSSTELQQRTKELAVDVSKWLEEVEQATQKSVLSLCVLRGGVFFYSDLLRQLSRSVEVAFCRCWTYSSEKNEELRPEMRVDIGDADCRGRGVLIVDDICDSGRTLFELEKILSEQNPYEMAAAVMVERKVESRRYFPRWSGFECESEHWLVGYGMEDSNSRANLDAIYEISA